MTTGMSSAEREERNSDGKAELFIDFFFLRSARQVVHRATVIIGKRDKDIQRDFFGAVFIMRILGESPVLVFCYRCLMQRMRVLQDGSEEALPFIGLILLLL